MYLHSMIGCGARIGDQVASNDRVDDYQNYQGKKEEQAHGTNVVEYRPERIGLCQTQSIVFRALLFVFGNVEHRTAITQKEINKKKCD